MPVSVEPRYDYADFVHNNYGRLELDRPNQGRIDAVYNAPWGLSAGLQFYVRTGTPTSISGYYNQFYTTELYLGKRGYAGRLPTDYEMNMSLGYNLNVGAACHPVSAHKHLGLPA